MRDTKIRAKRKKMEGKSVKILLFCAILSSVAVILCSGQMPNEKQPQTGGVTYGSPFDEIVVESSLNIRKKPTPVRQTRSLAELLTHSAVLRRIRQDDGDEPKDTQDATDASPASLSSPSFPDFSNFGGGFGNFGQDFGSSSAIANANAHNQYFGPGGFGGSAANAGAQAFESHGPLGSFGASASNAQSQGFSVGPNGITGSAGLSGGQTYNLPNGKTFSFTYGNTVSFGPDGKPTISRSNSASFS